MTRKRVKYSPVSLFFSVLFAVGLLTGCLPASDAESNKATETTESTNENKGDGDTANKPLSPRTEVSRTIGGNTITVDYSAPSKRGRLIFGGLVGFDRVWVTGAHKATSITFSENVIIAGEKVDAGTYGLFTIPGEEEWAVILNENYSMHLADDYDSARDILRVPVPPKRLSDAVEQLTFSIEESGSGEAEVHIAWDDTAVSFLVKNA